MVIWQLHNGHATCTSCRACALCSGGAMSAPAVVVPQWNPITRQGPAVVPSALRPGESSG